MVKFSGLLLAYVSIKTGLLLKNCNFVTIFIIQYGVREWTAIYQTFSSWYINLYFGHNCGNEIARRGRLVTSLVISIMRPPIVHFLAQIWAIAPYTSNFWHRFNNFVKIWPITYGLIIILATLANFAQNYRHILSHIEILV